MGPVAGNPYPPLGLEFGVTVCAVVRESGGQKEAPEQLLY